MDSSFALSQEERERVWPQFDAAAVEQLLQAVEPGERAQLFSQFARPMDDDEHRDASFTYPDGSAGIPTIRVLTGFSDPVLQELLDRIWQPYWENASDEMLLEDLHQVPGVELARRRRAVRNAERDVGGSVASENEPRAG